MPGQVVLALQGGGALGAYQVGVYEAMHQAGIEPDWVVGTSIGAINGALIAGNPPERRLTRLRAFWDHVEQQIDVDGPFSSGPFAGLGWGNALANWATVAGGIPAFFKPNPSVLAGTQANVGVDAAAYYDTGPLRETLSSLIDFDYLHEGSTRLTVGTVHVTSGALRYFDSREQRLTVDHVMASGALPPAFPAVRIEGEAYWDGGIYSNTPIEAVLDDRPRRDALIFAVNVWQPDGPEPQSIWKVMGRQKEIQYASRTDSHIARQQQIHRLRHVIRELQKQLPAKQRDAAEVKALTAWGCGTTMHVVRLLAPRLEGEDHTKAIDFTAGGVRARRDAGRADAQAVIAQAPWQAPVDPLEGVVVHELPSSHDIREVPRRVAGR
ncbi:MAG: patatin [Methylibium sp. NZG]|nr:MAG: patatin [Methylibium sp. NZG]